MTKKFIYDMKEIDDCFNEQLMIEQPNQKNYAEMLRGFNNNQLIALMINFLNRYGEDGWEFLSTIRGTTEEVFLCFKKEVPKGKETKVKESI